MMTPPTSRQPLSAQAVTELLERLFPQMAGFDAIAIDEITTRESVVRMRLDASAVRPGGTVSGPTMFKLADIAVYVAILSALGESAVQAVTTNMSINFLTRPQPGDMIARARLIKLGQRLAVAEVEIYADGRDDIVAQAVSTYSLPATVK